MVRRLIPFGSLPRKRVSSGTRAPCHGGASIRVRRVGLSTNLEALVGISPCHRFPGDIRWNFAGIFLFDKAGKPVARFSARELSKIEAGLDNLLADKEL